jgi:hypothetical protein
MKSEIQINVTLYGKTKTLTMSVDEWYKNRDAQFGVSPCDEKVGELLSQFT